MIHDAQTTETKFSVAMNGKRASANIVSRSVARDMSRQFFLSKVYGNAACVGHTECDSIVMDDAYVGTIPEIHANHQDASLVHEAAIGKIAGEQLIKLMTLGLTKKEAEAQIIIGFLK
jgi:Fe-S cluster assembly scaffold protein SufB